jgi:hypothetical protein
MKTCIGSQARGDSHLREHKDLWSLLDMIEFRSTALLALGKLLGLFSEEALFQRALPPLAIKVEKGGFGVPVRIISVEPQVEEAKKELLNGAAIDFWKTYIRDELIEGCKQLQLAMSQKQGEHILALLNSGTITVGQFCFALAELGQRLIDELEDKISLQIDAKHAYLYKNGKAFSEGVFQAFPSTNEDISEASTCLALDRGTACVMHLCRVVETGLRTLASFLELPSRHDWGKHLEDIERELTKRYKMAGTRTLEELFCAEAAAQIGHIKTAWRNPSVHVDKTYSPERAEEIFLAIQSFMKHLATKLRE